VAGLAFKLEAGGPPRQHLLVLGDDCVTHCFSCGRLSRSQVNKWKSTIHKKCKLKRNVFISKGSSKVTSIKRHWFRKQRGTCRRFWNDSYNNNLVDQVMKYETYLPFTIDHRNGLIEPQLSRWRAQVQMPTRSVWLTLWRKVQPHRLHSRQTLSKTAGQIG